MTSPYSAQWFAGLTAHDKQTVKELLGSNNKVLDKLVEICYNMYRESETTSNDFDSPNWALRQADLVGYRRALQRIIKLCSPTTDRRDQAETRKTMTNGQ